MTPAVHFLVEPAHRAELRAAGLDSLEACLAFAGGSAVKNRVTGRDVVRLGAGGITYFLKRIRGDGWREIVQECRVLQRLRRAGFPVPEPVAVGAAPSRAALVTVGVPASTTLERLLLDGGADGERTLRFARGAGETLRELHRQGVNHRDFYAGHLLVGPEDRLFVVDFGRAEVRRRVPRTRVVKDLAAFHTSLPARVFGDAARAEFLRTYLGPGVGRWRFGRWAAAVERRSRRMRRHAERKLARGEPNIHVNR